MPRQVSRFSVKKGCLELETVTKEGSTCKNRNQVRSWIWTSTVRREA